MTVYFKYSKDATEYAKRHGGSVWYDPERRMYWVQCI